MTTFADKLLAASEDASLSPGELRAWMRRAAMRLQEAEAAEALDRLHNLNEIRARNGEPLLGLEVILEDWFIGHGYAEDLNEETETKGSA